MSPVPPSGWELVDLGLLLDRIEAGASFSCDERPPGRGEVGVIKISAVTWGEYDEGESKTCRDPARIDARLFIREGDLLFSRANTIELVGACVIARNVSKRVMLSDKILRLHPRGVDPAWLLQVLRSPSGRAQIESLSGGNQLSMRNIGQDRIRRIRVPVPPLAEQRRIISTTHALDARSRRVRDALASVPGLIERFKQSVLAAAFRGDLTADWRAKHPEVEPATELLKRIRLERRRRWEEGEFEKLRAKGKPPTDDRWKSKYPEPRHLSEHLERHEAPEAWCWTSLDTLVSGTEPLCYGVVQPGDEAGDVDLVRVCDLAHGSVDLPNLRSISASVDSEYSRSRVRGGEVLVSVVGTIGRVAVMPKVRRPTNIARAVARIATQDPVLARWLLHWLSSPQTQTLLTQESREVARKTLNIETLAGIPVPLAPRDEIRRIVELLDHAGWRIQAMEAASSVAAENLVRLDHSILAKALRGELVPQDSNDEPASVLLERIRAERARAAETVADSKKKPRASAPRSRRARAEV
ncbi:hypothetical protein L6R52_21540 [Myxococcota bacterium]|nr:hypothetical protein [Myxococcota bacterium]